MVVSAFFLAEKKGMLGRSIDSGILSLVAGFVFGHAITLICDVEISILFSSSSKWALAASLPLLLLNPKLRRLLRDAGSIVWLFHVSIVGVVLGSLLVYYFCLVEHKDAEAIISVLSGSYSGGTVNFMAVRERVELPASTATSLYVADSLVMATIFVFLFKLRLNSRLNDLFPRRESSTELTDLEYVPEVSYGQRCFEMITVCACTIVIATLGFYLADKSSVFLELDYWPMLAQNIVGSFAFWITLISICASVLIPTKFVFVADREGLAIVLLNFYLFSVGVEAKLESLLNLPKFVLICAAIAFVNLLVTFLGATIMKANGRNVSLDEILLAVNASLGGPGTAAAMAARCGDSSLVASSTLVGVWGYAVGTIVGLSVYNLLKT